MMTTGTHDYAGNLKGTALFALDQWIFANENAQGARRRGSPTSGYYTGQARAYDAILWNITRRHVSQIGEAAMRELLEAIS